MLFYSILHSISILLQPWFVFGYERVPCMSAPVSEALFAPVGTLSDESGMKFLHKSLGPNVVNPNGKSSFQLMMDSESGACWEIRNVTANTSVCCSSLAPLPFKSLRSLERIGLVCINLTKIPWNLDAGS